MKIDSPSLMEFERPRKTSQEMSDLRAQARQGSSSIAVNEAIDKGIEILRITGVGETALKIGALAPEFSLPDPSGKLIWSHRLLQQGPLVIVFYRGNWCPYCSLHLRGFQRALPRLKDYGASLVAISPQKPDQSLSMQEKAELAFPILSDVGSVVAKKFGIVWKLSEHTQQLNESRGIILEDFNGAEGKDELPLPASFLIDQGGIIQIAHVEVDHTVRLDPDDVVDFLETLRSKHS